MVFKKKSKSERYLYRTNRDIQKVKRMIVKARREGERHVDVCRLFILTSKWNSDVFRDCVDYFFSSMIAEGYTVEFSNMETPSFGWLTVRWNNA